MWSGRNYSRTFCRYAFLSLAKSDRNLRTYCQITSGNCNRKHHSRRTCTYQWCIFLFPFEKGCLFPFPEGRYRISSFPHHGRRRFCRISDRYSGGIFLFGCWKSKKRLYFPTSSSQISNWWRCLMAGLRSVSWSSTTGNLTFFLYDLTFFCCISVFSMLNCI